tara:strand:- start:69 stop:350 length:282 start_codon:yes stop_codon:yes gene_type:complete
VVFVPKNRVLQARITDDTHEKLTRVCSELGCSITDYVTSVLDSSFDEEPIQIEPIVEDVKPMPRSQGIVKKVSYDDGKTWIEIQELENIRIVD